MRLKKAILILFQLILGTLLGIITYHKFKDLGLFDIIIIHFMATVGIAIPGFMYLKTEKNLYAFLPSFMFGIVSIMFGIFIYIVLAYFILSRFDILSTEISAILIPVSIGIIGFNIFAFNINKTSP